MLPHALRSPASFTFFITVASVACSAAVATIAMLVAGYTNFLFAYLLSAGVPAIAAPLTVYPLVKANRRLEEAQNNLQRMALTDVLTELPNRRAFFERAERIFAACGDNPVAVMMVDLDNFKAVNDTHGHVVGDAVLRQVGAALHDTVDGYGANEWVVARVGGEEFAIALGGVAPSSIARLAETIGRDVRKLDCEHEGEAILASVSIGVAMRRGGEAVDAVFKAADDAAYVAKRAGRDRWAFAGERAEDVLQPMAAVS